MLCEFANRFPRELALLLERDRHLSRNFREETATDLLMMGLTALQPLGVRVDFPDEVVTGADMDWIFAAPHEVGGGRYLRLLIQAKRAKEEKLKSKPDYWYYDQLDHGDPKGSQASTLMNWAASSPDGMNSLPIYMFYHPDSALQPQDHRGPAIEGVNLRLAKDVVGVVSGGCHRNQKRVEYWRGGFMSLSDLLCWPILLYPENIYRSTSDQYMGFLVTGASGERLRSSSAFHPDLVAQRINDRDAASKLEIDGGSARSSPGIPDFIQRAIAGEQTDEDREHLKRPRVIFSTNLTTDDQLFKLLSREIDAPE